MMLWLERIQRSAPSNANSAHNGPELEDAPGKWVQRVEGVNYIPFNY
jgi:hypothetical protein